MFWRPLGGPLDKEIGKVNAVADSKIIGRAPLPSTRPPLPLVQNGVIASEPVRRCLPVTARVNTPLGLLWP